MSSATRQVLFEARCLYFTLFMYLYLGLLFSEALGVAFLFGDRGGKGKDTWSDRGRRSGVLSFALGARMLG